MLIWLNANMRTTLDLPDALFRELKAQAALRGMTLKDLVTLFVEQGLHQKAATPRIRSPLPVARRVMPGYSVPAQSNESLNSILDEEDAQRYVRHES
jgi:hypothetical protein